MSFLNKQFQNKKQIGVLQNISSDNFLRGASGNLPKMGRFYTLVGRRRGMTQNWDISPLTVEFQFISMDVPKNRGNAPVQVLTQLRRCKHGTCLAAGDSMLGHINETRISRTSNVKVRPFPCAKISDMHQF